MNTRLIWFEQSWRVCPWLLFKVKFHSNLILNLWILSSSPLANHLSAFFKSTIMLFCLDHLLQGTFLNQEYIIQLWPCGIINRIFVSSIYLNVLYIKYQQHYCWFPMCNQSNSGPRFSFVTDRSQMMLLFVKELVNIGLDNCLFLSTGSRGTISKEIGIIIHKNVIPANQFEYKVCKIATIMCGPIYVDCHGKATMLVLFQVIYHPVIWPLGSLTFSERLLY